jgi:hypothetical protein
MRSGLLVVVLPGRICVDSAADLCCSTAAPKWGFASLIWEMSVEISLPREVRRQMTATSAWCLWSSAP